MSGCESHFGVHVRDVVWTQLQTAGQRPRVGGESAVKAEMALITSLADQRVDEQKVRAARRNDPATISRDVDTNDRIT